MKKFLFFICCLFSFISLTNAQVKTSSTPDWVVKSTYNVSPKIAADDNSQGLVGLLFDSQMNNNTKQAYYRYVTKIVENVGIQPASSINVEYDPSYQKISFHKITIIRNGKTINKLNASDFQLIRKETNSESYIYDGSMSAISNITDVRLGDIIDYSFTITGANPIHKNKFSTSMYFNSVEPIGKINVAILSKSPLQFKYINTYLKFKKSSKNGSNYYTISDTDIKGVDFEEATPSWKPIYASVSITDYTSWEDVVTWGVDVFKIKGKTSTALQKKINEIKRKNKTVGTKINAVLNFTQNEIRYLGLESGIGAYKPFSPNKVFEQRFGDCKDKSLLMAHMLNKMGIESYPMLVNTSIGKTVPELLPSPKYFDHCIVKVIDDYNEELWYDPTITNQGGEYRSRSLPNYEFGLVLKKGNKGFDKITTDITNSVDVVDEFTLEEVGKGATLKSTTTYYDSEADFIRGYYKNNSINSIKKEYEKYLSQYFYNIKSIENPSYEDDLRDNKFTVTESYKIDSIWTTYGINKDQIIATFQPYTIINVLSMPSKRVRKMPYALYYPSSRTHTMKIKLPEKWNVENDIFSISSPEMDYDFLIDYAQFQDLLTLKHSIKINESYVEAENFTNYYDNIKKLDNTIAYSLIIPKEGNSKFFSNVSLGEAPSFLKLFLVFILLIAIVLIAYKVYQNSIKE